MTLKRLVAGAAIAVGLAVLAVDLGAGAGGAAPIVCSPSNRSCDPGRPGDPSRLLGGPGGRGQFHLPRSTGNWPPDSNTSTWPPF